MKFKIILKLNCEKRPVHILYVTVAMMSFWTEVNIVREVHIPVVLGCLVLTIHGSLGAASHFCSTSFAQD